jgi:hypothetical protein
MRGNRLLALLAVVMTASCTTAPKRPNWPPTPTAELGTVSPAYPVGGQLEPGIEVIDRIPVEKLATESAPVLDEQDPCAGIPDKLIAAHGFDTPPAASARLGCYWTEDGGLQLMVAAYPPTPMAKEVEEHLRDASGGGTDVLAHLTWLRIDGHYALERILATDPASSCWLSVDVSAPQAVYVVIMRTDESGTAIPADLRRGGTTMPFWEPGDEPATAAPASQMLVDPAKIL